VRLLWRTVKTVTLKKPLKAVLCRANNDTNAKTVGATFAPETTEQTTKSSPKKALCILLYAMAKGSYRMLGRILGIDHTLVYRWIKEYGENLSEPEISGEITQMEFDEMWHFIGSKKKNLGHQSH
jgi:hypothetical protein